VSCETGLDGNSTHRGMIAQALYDGVRNLLVGKWMTTFAVLNFYMYPSILRVSFGIQKCVALDDGQLHPFADLDTKCIGQQFKIWTGVTGFLVFTYMVCCPLVRLTRNVSFES